MQRHLRTIMQVFLLVSLFYYMGTGEAEAAETSSANPHGKIISSNWVTSGAKLENWEWVTEAGKVRINLIEIDLQNPYLKIGSIIGKDSQTGNKQRMKQMAEENQAVAAINGDFFTLNKEGAPFGVHIQDSELITSPGYIYSKNSFAIDENNVPSIGRIDFDSTIIAEDGARFQLFGINKTEYQAGYRFSGSSHIDRLHMYTDKWNANHWVGDNFTNYVTVLVEENRVSKIIENAGVPSIPKGAYVLLAQGKAAEFVREHIKVGESIHVDFSLLPGDQLFETAIDGTTLLVDEGAKATLGHQIKGLHARTAVGYSKDKRFVYMVTVEKSSISVGMELEQLTAFLLERGVWKAVNLDGGGSTTMVSRPLGTTKLVDVTAPAYGVEREVPNGLAIFSTAPKGELKGIQQSIPQGVFVGETIKLKLDGAYDQYYNPIDPSTINVTWSASGGTISRENELTFEKTGTHELKLSAGTISQTVKIKVFDASEIKTIKFSKDSIRLHSGEKAKPEVKVTFLDGTTRVIPNELLKWSLAGVSGTVAKDGTVTANKQSAGILIAEYQGYSTSIPIDIGGKNEFSVIDYFDTKGHYLFEGHTKGETANIEVLNEGNRKLLQFKYDFGSSEALRIAYLKYGTLGKSVPGMPASLSIDVKGDKSNHWLRSEIRDANGAVHYLDLAKKVDWEGWKELKVDLPTSVKYPITIKSIYAVHLDNASDSTRNNGQLSFSNLRMNEWRAFEDKVSSNLVFTLNKKEVMDNGVKVQIDQAPLVVDGRTYLPIRHITELLGGSVQWNSTERKVRVINHYKTFDFWLNQEYMNNNGARTPLDAKAFVSSGRTMLPLRSIAEAYGLYVHYDKATKRITVR